MKGRSQLVTAAVFSQSAICAALLVLFSFVLSAGGIGLNEPPPLPTWLLADRGSVARAGSRHTGDERGFELRRKVQQLRPREALLEHRLAMLIKSYQMERRLPQVDADGCNVLLMILRFKVPRIFPLCEG
jgi:hypothetical protein